MINIELKNAKIPALGFGTWPLAGEGAVSAVKTALAIGYRHIDTAQLYGNEAEIGKGIAQSGVPRGDIWLTTKLARNNLAAADVKRSAEESLKKLGTDYVDLLLIHWPVATVPLGETLGAMAELRKAGKARFIGVSNFTVSLLDEAIGKHHADIVCDQVEYHPYLNQRAVLTAVRKHGLMLTAYSPVARGRAAEDKVLAAIGKKHGKSPAQISLRWLVEQKNVAAVPKAGTRAHAEANFTIFDFALDTEDRARIDKLGGNDRIVDIAGWAPDWDRA